MASSNDFLPRLDILFDLEREWSVAKFAEAIKLHAMLLWPRDKTARRRHIAIMLTLHRDRVTKRIAAANARSAGQSSAKIDGMRRDLDELHQILMSQKAMNRAIFHSPSFAEHRSSIYKQREGWKKILMFIDFSLRYAAAPLEEDSPFMIKLFYPWAYISAKEALKSDLDNNKISEEEYDEQSSNIKRGYGRTTLEPLTQSARRIGHILYAASQLNSRILRVRFSHFIHPELDLNEAFEDAKRLRHLAAYASCVADKLDGPRSDWLGRDDLRRAGGRLLERVRKWRGPAAAPRPFSEAERTAINSGREVEHQKPHSR
jgi:hypothetical protein